MRLHPREHDAGVAREEFAAAVWRLLDAADLTLGEAMGALTLVQSDLIRGAIRRERHPRHPQHPAGEACTRKRCPGSWRSEDRHAG